MLRAALGFTALIGCAACGALLELDGEEAAGKRPDLGGSSSGDVVDDATSSSGGASTSSGGSSGGGSSTSSTGGPHTDAGLLPAPACGAMQAYAASSWPMAAACPTRPAAAAVPRLQNAHIKWRKDYALNDAFVSAPSLGADGTVYASLAVRAAVGFDYFVVGVRDGTEVARTALPSGPAGTPTVAANGRLFVRTDTALVAIDPALPQPLWTRAIASSADASPILLADGTVVTAAGHDLVFTHADGTPSATTITLGTGTAPSFRGSLAVSETGILYAVGTTAPASYGGRLWAFSPADGSEFFPAVALDSPALPSPSFTSTGDLFVRGNGFVSVRSRSSGQLIAQIASGHDDDGPWPARSGERYFLSGGANGPFSFETTSHTRADYGEADVGRHSDFSVAGDGSVLFARSSLVGSPLARVCYLESWNADASFAWRVTLDPEEPSSHRNPALGSDGTAYLAFARTLYAIGD